MDEMSIPIWNFLSPESIKRGLGSFKPYIPDRFRRKLYVHTISNFLSYELGKRSVGVPLMLGIQGPTGEGKSWQTRLICAEMNIPVIRVSGASLSSRWEGVPQQLLREAYVFASKQNKGYSVLLIDDFDTSPASTKEDVQYTINTQILCGALMNIADDPKNVSGEEINRIPIVVTGNDFTALYYPLTRLGRMAIFSWVPTDEERKEIIKAIFHETKLTDSEIATLAGYKYGYNGQLRNVPVSFYDQLKMKLWEEHIWQTIVGKRTRDARKLSDAIAHHISKDGFGYSFQDLVKVADEIQVEHKTQAFI